MSSLLQLFQLANHGRLQKQSQVLALALGLVGLMSLPAAQAAIPLLGPCDPDFRSSAGCNPGPSKDERPAVPVAAPKAPKSSAAPAAAPAPLKSAPAAKSPNDARPDTSTQTSQPADETSSKVHRVEASDDTAPLTLTLTVGP